MSCEDFMVSGMYLEPRPIQTGGSSEVIEDKQKATRDIFETVGPTGDRIITYRCRTCENESFQLWHKYCPLCGTEFIDAEERQKRGNRE